MPTPSWDSLSPVGASSAPAPAQATPEWDSLTSAASTGASAATSPDTAQPVPAFEALPTRAEYLKMLPRSRIEDEYIKAKESGEHINEQEYLDAYRTRAREGNLTGDKDLTSNAPSPSLWERTKAAASNLDEGLLTHANEIGKFISGHDIVNDNLPVSDYSRGVALSNLVQGAQVAGLRSATTVRQMVNNLANKMFRSTNAVAPIFSVQSGFDDKADNKAYDEQFRANIHAKEVEARITQGKQVLGDQTRSIDVSPEQVQSVSNSPLSDPTVLVPGLVSAKLAEEGLVAGKAVNVAEKAAAPGIARAALAKPVELAANAVKAANTALDTSPLLRAATTAGITLAAGGEAPMATLTALLGASSPKMNLLQGSLSAAEGAIRNTAEKIAGRLSPGPMGQFAGKTFSALGDEGKALALTQAANLPFLLGTENEEDFKNFATVGILGHYAIGTPLKAANSLNFANNFWKSSPHLVSERMPVKDIGTSPVLDQLHRETLTAADNTGNNFVQSMRNYFGKRAELYVLTPEKMVDAIKALKDEGATLPPEIGDNPQAAAAQNGVTSLNVSMPDGTKRNLAFATLRDGVPGLGAGHETGHLIESITSPEEIKPLYEAIAQAYGEDGIAKAKAGYERAAEASGQPYQNLSRDAVVSELFAENASAVLNSIPIGEFGPEGFKGWRNTARKVYVSVERALNKIGAKVPETDGSSSGIKTGLGYDPSAPVGQLIENLIEAKRVDSATFSPEPETVVTDKGEKVSPLQSVREVPPEHALPKGLPVEELKVDGKVVATDGKITALLDPVDGIPQYELTYTDPVDGKRKAGVVSEKALQSEVSPDAVAEATPKPKAGTVFPKSPVTSETPAGVATRPATAEELVAPKQVENVTRPAAEAPKPAPAPEAKPNVRVTSDQQTGFAQKASPAVQAENTAALKSATSLPRKDIPVFETDYFSAKSNVFSPDAVVRGEQRRLADKADAEAAKSGRPNPLRAVYQKLFVPYKFVEGATPRVYGFSLDKVIQNVDILRGWLRESVTSQNPLVEVRQRLENSQFANTVHDYLENQRNGYGGDGSTLKLPADAKEGTITPANPDYTPKKLSEADKQLVNLVMGIELPQKSSPGSRFAARMAEQNGLTPVLNSNGVEITNPLYSELVKNGFNPKLLNSAVENLPVANFTTKLKARNDLKSSAGDVAITRAGFMPATEGKQEKAPAYFIGHQEGVGDLYNLTADINGHRKGSTVTAETLKNKGFTISERRAQGNDNTRQIAARYIEENSLGNTPHEGLAPIDENLAKKIADFYQEAKHDPEAPEVKQAYQALADETLKQYEAMRSAGIHIEPFNGKGEPYKNSKAMMEDVKENKHLFFLKTEGNFSESANNPLLQDSGVKAGGQKLLVNDVFRAVHDFFGHTAEGYEFGPRGEYNAYLAHSKMFTEEAKPALAAETLAQNSFVNYGKHLRREDGSIPVKGDADFKPLSERPFAEQKNLVVPKKLLDAVDTASASFMPAQHVAKKPLEHSLGDETLKLIHYGQSGLKELDPAKFGKSGITPKSEMTGSNRVYFYEKGGINKSDPATARKDIYEAAVSGSRIYDGDTDALGYADNINKWKADDMLQKEGYVGIARSAGRGKNAYKQVELFSPTKVVPTGKGSASFMPAAGEADVTESRTFKNIAKHLTPEEAAGIRRDTAASMVELYKSLPKDEDFETAVAAGIAKKGWYKRAGDSLKFIFGDDTGKFVSLLAAMSPQQSVAENLHMSLKTWADWQDAGRPLDTPALTEIIEKHAQLHARVPNSVRAFQGYELAEPVKKSLENGAHLSGFKVESFRKNLLGVMVPSTNDTWMAMFSNIDQAEFGSKSGYLAFNSKIRKVADKLNLKPAEVQETVWSFFKTLLDSTTVKRDARSTLAALSDSDILNTPEFHEELIQNPKIKRQLERLGFTGFDQLANREDSQRPAPRAGSLVDVALKEGGPSRVRVLNRIADRAQKLKDADTAATDKLAAPEESDAPFMPAVGREVLGSVKGEDEVELRILPANSQSEHRDFGMRGDRFRFNTADHTITWTDLREEVTPSTRRAAQEQLERKGYSVTRQVDWQGHPYTSLSVTNPPILKKTGDKRLSHVR